jgi:hypothetical protein
VLDEHQRDVLALPQFAHLFDHLPAFLGPHAGGRLVEEQHARLENQSEPDVQQLLVAMREVRGDDRRLVGEPEHVHRREGALAAFRQRETAHDPLRLPQVRLHRRGEDRLDGQRGKDRGDLERARDTAPHDLRRRQPDDVLARERGRSPRLAMRAPQAPTTISRRKLSGCFLSDALLQI